MKVQTIDYKDEKMPTKLLESFVNTGFAVITNHPIRSETIDGVYAEWAKFFASPNKEKYLFDPAKQSGFFPFKTENAKDSKFKDLKEFYHLFTSTPEPEGIGEPTKRLRRELNTLGILLLSALHSALPSRIHDQLSEPLYHMAKNSPGTLFRILHYPPIVDCQVGEVRSAPHEDINLITLLPAATEPGLQVKDLAGKWIDVPCDKGSIVVNAGDMLKEATGGYIPSTTHQVINPSGEAAKVARYSMPLFVHPRPEVVLSERHTQKSFLDERLREIGLK